MEPSQFVAFCRYRDKAVQRIDAYVNERQWLENDPEIAARFRELAVRETLPEGPTKPTGYLRSGKPILWNGVCCGWPESARLAADVLRHAGEIVQASGIYEELSTLPDEITNWNRLEEYHDATREAAEQVKAILTAIRPEASGGPLATDDEQGGPWSQADAPKCWGKVFGFSAATFIRRVKAGTIRAKKLSDKSYQVHLGDIPQKPK